MPAGSGSLRPSKEGIKQLFVIPYDVEQQTPSAWHKWQWGPENTIVKQKEEEREYYVKKKNAKHEGRWHKWKNETRKYRFALK